MKSEWIRAVSEKYIEKMQQLKLQGSEEYCHFDHITRNLSNHINPTWVSLIEKGKRKWEDIRENYVKSMKALRTYYRLLDKYPEYKNLELNTEEGTFHFDDRVDLTKYVYFSRDKLNE